MPISTLIQQALCVSASVTLVAFSTSDAVYAAAIGFTEPTIDFTNELFGTLGFQFRTNTTITVNRLGFYDDEKNGLKQPQQVQILDEKGELILVQGTVAADAPLQGWFRYTSVAPTVLEADQVFTILAVGIGKDRYTWDPIRFVVDPAIAFERNVFLTTDSSNNPILATDGKKIGWFGPNFQVARPPNPSPAPVPAIPTPALLPGLIGIGIAVWRKRQQAGE